MRRTQKRSRKKITWYMKIVERMKETKRTQTVEKLRITASVKKDERDEEEEKAASGKKLKLPVQDTHGHGLYIMVQREFLKKEKERDDDEEVENVGESKEAVIKERGMIQRRNGKYG